MTVTPAPFLSAISECTVNGARPPSPSGSMTKFLLTPLKYLLITEQEKATEDLIFTLASIVERAFVALQVYDPW